MTLARQHIIDRYHQRIAAGERTRLTKTDLSELIGEFVDRLAIAKSKAKIQTICTAEIALLEEGYPQATIGKVYLPMYRKAIQTAMDDGLLPLTKNTSRQYTYTKRNSGESVTSIDHLALDYLKYDTAIYSQFAGISAERNNLKQDNLQPVNPEAFLAVAANLLQSDDPFDLAVGLAATTGRRFSEVVAKGTLTATNDLFWISFSGQLKKREQADSYLTPCLMPAVIVLEAMERFRQHPRIAALADFSAIELNRSLADSVKRSVMRNFGDSGIVPVLPSESAVTVHNLRGIYGEICTHFFCPPDRAVSRFVQERLGHVISADELKRANSSATQHYFHYYLVDSNGHHLGSKGIKLSAQDPLANNDHLDPDLDILTSPVQLELLTSPKIPVASKVLSLTQELAAARNYIVTLEQDVADLRQANLGYQQRITQLTNVLRPAISKSTAKLTPAAFPSTALLSTPPPPQRRVPAATKIWAAIEAIMLWNQQNEQKFAISQTLLLKATGCNLPAIKRVLAEQVELIDRHHAEFDIQPRHQSKKIDLILAFLQNTH